MGRRKKKRNPIEIFSSGQDILSLFEIIKEAIFLKKSKFSGLWQGGFKKLHVIHSSAVWKARKNPYPLIYVCMRYSHLFGLQVIGEPHILLASLSLHF